jgi:hypothetical protein
MHEEPKSDFCEKLPRREFLKCSGKIVLSGAAGAAVVGDVACSSEKGRGTNSGEAVTGRTGISKADDFIVLNAQANQGSQTVQLRPSKKTVLAMLDPKNIPITLENGHNPKHPLQINVQPKDPENIGDTTLVVSTAVLKNYKLGVSPGMVTRAAISFSDKELNSLTNGSVADMKSCREVGLMDLSEMIFPKLKVVVINEKIDVIGSADFAGIAKFPEGNKRLHEKINSLSISGSPQPPSEDVVAQAFTGRKASANTAR